VADAFIAFVAWQSPGGRTHGLLHPLSGRSLSLRWAAWPAVRPDARRRFLQLTARRFRTITVNGEVLARRGLPPRLAATLFGAGGLAWIAYIVAAIVNGHSGLEGYVAFLLMGAGLWSDDPPGLEAPAIQGLVAAVIAIGVAVVVIPAVRGLLLFFGLLGGFIWVPVVLSTWALHDARSRGDRAPRVFAMAMLITWAGVILGSAISQEIAITLSLAFGVLAAGLAVSKTNASRAIG
jgi:hypothetical protein